MTIIKLGDLQSLKISLGELKAARGAMTPGEWALASIGDRPADRVIALPSESHVADLRVSAEPESDAHGIVETHNAADVLIAIAVAALQLREADIAAHEAMGAWTVDQSAEHWQQLEVVNAARRIAKEAYDDALARVTL